MPALVIRLFLPLLLLPLALPSSTPAAEAVRLTGSGAPLASVPILAQVFARDCPGTPLVVKGVVGSGGGIKAVAAGQADIALTSRPMSEGEKALGLRQTPYARTPLAVVASPGNRFPGLTLARLADILAGRLDRWPDGTPLRLIFRPATDSDTVVLKETSPAMAEAVEAALAREGLAVANNDLENLSLIARTPGALGFATLGQVSSEGGSLVLLAIEGIEPSLESLARGSHPWSKTFYAVTLPSPRREVRIFLESLGSPAGRAALLAHGQAPLP